MSGLLFGSCPRRHATCRRCRAAWRPPWHPRSRSASRPRRRLRPSRHSHRSATGFSAPSAAIPSRSCGSPRTCFAQRSPPETKPPSSTGPSPRSFRTLPETKFAATDRPRRSPRDGYRLTPHPRGGQTRGLAARPRALRLRGNKWSALPRAGLSGVPSCPAVCGGGRSHGGERAAAVSASQHPRGEGVLRAGTCLRWRWVRGRRGQLVLERVGT